MFFGVDPDDDLLGLGSGVMLVVTVGRRNQISSEMVAVFDPK
jgi:hypothetical protein